MYADARAQFEKRICADAARKVRGPQHQRTVYGLHCPALSDARAFIMDELMINLAAAEKEIFVRFMKEMRAQGRSIIYITHNIGEGAFAVRPGDELRDGKNVAVCSTKGLSAGRLSLPYFRQRIPCGCIPPKAARQDKILLETSHLSMGSGIARYQPGGCTRARSLASRG